MNRTTVLLASAAVLCVIALTGGSRTTAPKLAAGPHVPPAPVRPLAAVSPGATLTLTAQLSSGRVLAGESTVYAKVDLRSGTGGRAASRVPVNLALAIDRSGSMSNGKLQQAKQAAVALLDQLQPGDRLAVIAFDDAMQTYPSTLISAWNKGELRRFIDQIYEAGGTNISGALEAGHAQLQPWANEYQVSRVVLLSDGQPTVGRTSTTELAQLAAAARERKISTSAFGVGLDFSAEVMRELASRGGGGFTFVENAANLGPAFARELGDASQLLARDVAVELELPPGVSLEDVPGHTFSRRGGGVVEVPIYDFGPGQSAQLLLRLKVSAPAEGLVSLGEVRARFFDVQARAAAQVEQQLTAAVTGDANEVNAASNTEVMEMVKAVDITTRVQQAQAAYERGDTTSAFDIMANTRRLFGMSADALAGDEASIEGNWRRGGEDARRANLNLNKKTMKNFGENNAY